MKKQILLITGILALGLPWAGCNKSPKTEWSSPAPQTLPTGPLEFKLKWPVGGRQVLRLDIINNMETFVPMMAEPRKTDIELGQKLAFSVLNARQDGGHEVEMEFVSSRMTLKQGTKTEIDFDSTRRASKDGKDPASSMLRKMAGVRVRYLLDASNRVDLVLGLDEVRQRIGAGENDPSGMVSAMFNEDSLKQYMNVADQLPAKPVEPGDTWPVQQEISMGNLGMMTMNYTYTFKGWEMHSNYPCARLEFEGTVTRKADADSKVQGMTFVIRDGKASGETWFDPARGFFPETVMKQNMEMLITVPMPRRGNAPNAPQTMNITNLMALTVIAKVESAR